MPRTFTNGQTLRDIAQVLSDFRAEAGEKFGKLEAGQETMLERVKTLEDISLAQSKLLAEAKGGLRVMRWLGAVVIAANGWLAAHIRWHS